MLSDEATVSQDNRVINVSGTIGDVNAVDSLSVNGTPVPFDSDGVFSQAVNLIPGSNEVVFSATDVPGNTGVSSRTIHLDEMAPVLQIESPADNSVVNSGSVEITGVADLTAMVTVVVNGGGPQGAVRNGLQFTDVVTLDPGLNTIEIIAAADGEISMAKRTVFYDPSKPEVSINFPNQDSSTSNDSLIISGRVGDPSATVDMLLDGTLAFTPTIDGSGVFAQPMDFIEKKPYIVTATATDGSSNASATQRNILKGEYFGLSQTISGPGSTTVSPGGASCSQDCTLSYPENSLLTLTASPSVGSTFTGWSGACTGIGDCTVTMDSAKSVTATFVVNSYSLDVSKEGAGNVTGNPTGIACGADCSDIFNHGTEVTLTATPAAGSTFLGWGGACTGSGSCTVTMDAAKSVTATFGYVCSPPGTVSLPSASTTGSYQLSWLKSYLTGEATYQVEESSNGGASWTTVATNLTANYLNLNGRTNGSYLYRVKTMKPGYIDSSWKQKGPITVTLTCGTPGAIYVPASSTTGSYRISWGKSVTLGARYQLEESSNGGGSWTVVGGNLTVTYKDFSGKTAGSSYLYRVKATKDGIADSAWRTAGAATVVY